MSGRGLVWVWVLALAPWVVAASHAGASQLSTTEAEASCRSALMQFSCNQANTTQDDVLQYISRSYATCMENGAQPAGPSQLKVLASMGHLVRAALASPLLPASVASRFLCFEVDASRVSNEALDELFTNMTDPAVGWLVPTWVVDLLFAVNALQAFGDAAFSSVTGPQALPLSAYLPGALGLPALMADAMSRQLEGIPTYFQRAATVGTVVWLPADGAVQLLMYRQDVLRDRGWAVPATWSELVDMAEQLNGTDLNADGQPDWGFCMDAAVDCYYSELLGAILAPMLQFNGSQQGMLFSPEDLEPRLNTSAMEAALGLFVRLARVAPPLRASNSQAELQLEALRDALLASGAAGSSLALHAMRRMGLAPSAACGPAGSGHFQGGRCAFTVGTGHIWKAAQAPVSARPPTVEAQGSQLGDTWFARGQIGVSMLPGSEVVLDDSKNQLVPCTPSLCPYGLSGTPEAGRAAAGPFNSTGTGERYVNRAPYSVAQGSAAAISTVADPKSQQDVAALWQALITADVHNKLAMSLQTADLQILPMRTEVLTLDALSNFASAGFHPNDTQSYLRAVLDTISHPNIVMSSALRGNLFDTRIALDYAARQAVSGAQPAALAQLLQVRMLQQVLKYQDVLEVSDLSSHHSNVDVEGVLSQSIPYLAKNQASLPAAQARGFLLMMYRLAIGYYNTSSSAGPAAAPEAPSSRLPVVSLVVPITCAVVVLLLSVLYELRKHMEHRSLFGKVVAPGPCKETTLLVTDIESSTTLWELLPPHVMDVTLHQHHACIRQILLKHSGYESATEGDSFILAFHCPEDALLFAMECQVALLECAWPQELLECEHCAPAYVVQVESDRAHLGPLAALDEDIELANRLVGSADTPPNPTLAQLPGPHAPAKQDSFNLLDALPPSKLPNISIIAEEEREGMSCTMSTLHASCPTPGASGFQGVWTSSVASTAAASTSQAQAPETMQHDAGDPQAPPRGGLSGECGEAGNATPSAGCSLLQYDSQVHAQGALARQESRLQDQLATGLASALGLSSGKATLTQGGHSSVASSPMGERTFLTEVQASWQPVSADTPNAVLLFRGLRVRMGMASGITSESDVTYNKAAARTHYSGEIMQLAKAVSDAAPGGAMLLNESAHALLPMESLWDKALVMHIGEYVLNDSLPTLDLYQVAGRRLLGRIAYLSVSRCQATLTRGVLAAPVGNVAVAQAQAVGAQALLAWNTPVAQEALDLFMAEVTNAMGRLSGGYLADVQTDQATVVFALASEAIIWGLLLQKALLECAWPPELLDHELCEELCVNGELVFRGLRCKVGIDSGEVVGEVDARTGRCVYRGRPVVRSLRVMATASSHQVLATSHAWTAANTATNVGLLTAHQVSAERLGLFKLRGERLDKTELLQCRLGAKPVVNKRRASVLMSEDLLPAHLTDVSLLPACESPMIGAQVAHQDLAS